MNLKELHSLAREKDEKHFHQFVIGEGLFGDFSLIFDPDIDLLITGKEYIEKHYSYVSYLKNIIQFPKNKNYDQGYDTSKKDGYSSSGLFDDPLGEICKLLQYYDIKLFPRKEVMEKLLMSKEQLIKLKIKLAPTDIELISQDSEETGLFEVEVHCNKDQETEVRRHIGNISLDRTGFKPFKK